MNVDRNLYSCVATLVQVRLLQRFRLIFLKRSNKAAWCASLTNKQKTSSTTIEDTKQKKKRLATISFDIDWRYGKMFVARQSPTLNLISKFLKRGSEPGQGRQGSWDSNCVSTICRVWSKDWICMDLICFDSLPWVLVLWVSGCSQFPFALHDWLYFMVFHALFAGLLESAAFRSGWIQTALTWFDMGPFNTFNK